MRACLQQVGLWAQAGMQGLLMQLMTWMIVAPRLLCCHGLSEAGTSIPVDQDLLLCALFSSQQHAEARTQHAGTKHTCDEDDSVPDTHWEAAHKNTSAKFSTLVRARSFWENVNFRMSRIWFRVGQNKLSHLKINWHWRTDGRRRSDDGSEMIQCEEEVLLWFTQFLF